MATFAVNFKDDKLQAEIKEDCKLQAEIDSKPVEARMDVTSSAEFNTDFSQDTPMNVDLGEVFYIQALEGDYNSLENKPKINGIPLVGNKTTDDLKIKGVTDHRELTNRDASDQHPIGAITDLEAELAARPTAILSNMDIQRILGM